MGNAEKLSLKSNTISTLNLAMGASVAGEVRRHGSQIDFVSRVSNN